MSRQDGLDVFISYAREDEPLRQALEKHLAFLARRGLVHTWHDRCLLPGEEWARAIDDHLESADVVLLLVSADFIASDYCWEVEVKRAVERHEAGEARVVPVIARACEWRDAPFGRLQALPKDGRPVVLWTDQDEAWLDVARGVRAVIEEQSGKKTGRASPRPSNPQTRGPVIQQRPIEDEKRPPWAVQTGRDVYGLWADFEVEGVVQRLRWIPGGRFQMGSPESEAGREDREGPRHPVTLSEGFWLADTPCTQALWQVVLGRNPSRFQSPRRPVEQVSWDDCQEFLDRLNEQVAGLEARLPTEAQWEYACRAGTETGTWVGDLEFLSLNKAPLLDEIAWYGGNSGVGFDLKKGDDSSGWPEKQYEHRLAGTREVALKSPNPWGLYDMLGNVFEWCSGWYRRYSEDEAVDPCGPDKGEDRVARGGSWDSHARDVRAAYRYFDLPSLRWYDLGFRLARGQSALERGRSPGS